MSQRIVLQEAFKLALSLTLFYGLALSLDWYMPKYGALAIAVISLDTVGASLQKGLMRMAGTTVGLLVALLGLALFAQDPWLTLLFHCVYLTVIAYFIPTSRYPYAWYVAGFLPSLVWSHTYGDTENAFHYATFRYLETSAGILIYTLVSVLLWRRSAADALDHAVGELAAGQGALFGSLRRRLEDGAPAEEEAAEVAALAAASTKLGTTLQAALVDTPAVAATRRSWQALRRHEQALEDALALWREAIDDVRQLDLQRLLPGLGAALDQLDQRFARMDGLWRARSGDATAETNDVADATRLVPVDLRLERAAVEELAWPERAALLGFVRELEVVDRTSRAVLGTLRVLAGLDDARAHGRETMQPEFQRPPRWDPARLAGALLAPGSFAVGYLIWMGTDPPGGTSVPKMSMFLAMLATLYPISGLIVATMFIKVTCFAVAPVYIFILPNLHSATGLMTLLFCYGFAAGWIGGRKPVLKTLMLALFVMMADITNNQTFSIMVLVNGVMTYVLAGAAVVTVQSLLTPRRPEQVLRHGVRRFFHGCARAVDDLASGRGEPSTRMRFVRSSVVPLPARLQVVAAKLDHQTHPAGGEGGVSGLLAGMQSVATRLQALEEACLRATGEEPSCPEALRRSTKALRDCVQGVFRSCAGLEPAEVDRERRALDAHAEAMEAQMGETLQATGQVTEDDESLVDLYTVMGRARGLVRATRDMLASLAHIDWQAWAQARF